MMEYCHRFDRRRWAVVSQWMDLLWRFLLFHVDAAATGSPPCVSKSWRRSGQRQQHSRIQICALYLVSPQTQLLLVSCKSLVGDNFVHFHQGKKQWKTSPGSNKRWLSRCWAMSADGNWSLNVDITKQTRRISWTIDCSLNEKRCHLLVKAHSI